jgi:hypothetical protein
MKKTILLFILAFSVSLVKSQVNVNKYLWEYPLQQNLTVDATLQAILWEEMQKVIDSGSLFLRPVSCRYHDMVYEDYFLYQEPGRIIQTVALAWPYLSKAQQNNLRSMVPALFGSTIHAPWSYNQPARDEGTRRELYEADTIWGINSYFGHNRPTIQGVYSVWLWLYRTGDTSSVQPYYEEIKTFYNYKTGEGTDPGNLYGTYCAHIGMARLARIFNDTAQISIAAGNLSANLEHGLDIHYVDSMAFYGKQGWDAPYGSEYDPRRDHLVYRGFIFLNLSPEIGRYLKDTLSVEVTQRHNEGLHDFPLWWVSQAPYFCRWTGDEGVGIPREVFGMIMPVERWVIGRSPSTMRSYMQSAPTGIADCYWLEALVTAIESDATDTWVDVRNTPFSTDTLSGIPAITNLNMIIPSGVDTCFAATQTIITAGDGQLFTVPGGGSATLVAGHTVLMKTGTSVLHQGYLHARISTGGNYCTQQPTLPGIVPEPESFHVPAGISQESQFLFAIYPNPTAGTFTLELTSPDELSMISAEIFSILGKKVMQTQLAGNLRHEFDLSGVPEGVYLLRLINGTKTGFGIVIKQ